MEKCLSRAAAVLGRHGLAYALDSYIEEDRQYGYVWGWSSDARATAEVSCDRKNKETDLMFAEYTDDQSKTLEKWKALESDEW